MTRTFASVLFFAGLALAGALARVKDQTPSVQVQGTAPDAPSAATAAADVQADRTAQAYATLVDALRNGRAVTPETLETLCRKRVGAREIESDDSRAVYIRGLCSLTGYGSGPRQMQPALSDLEAGAQNGHVVSALTLALVYREGVFMAASDSRSCFWYRTAAAFGATVGQRVWQQCVAAGITPDARGGSNADWATEQRRQARVREEQQWQRQQEFWSWKNAQADARFQESQWRRQQERFERYAQEARDQREERRRREW